MTEWLIGVIIMGAALADVQVAMPEVDFITEANCLTAGAQITRDYASKTVIFRCYVPPLR